MVVLDVAGLHTSFAIRRGSLPVLEDISFALGPGETLGIVGESGSGKSMLARSLVRLLPGGAAITSGSISFAGRDLVAMREKELDKIRGAEIGFVFQNPVTFLNPTRRIGAQMGELLRMHANLSAKEAAARSTSLLEEVRISKAAERLHAYPHELSGGMCQRVAIAMAIACTPRLILADEPTTALDATVESEVLRLLEDVRAAHGIAMIVISHDMRVVSRLADRVAVMYAGEFVEVGPAAEVFAEPQHPYTEALLASVPRVDDPAVRRARLRTIEGSPPRLGRWGEGCRFAPRCRYGTDDGCADSHPPMREVAPGHLVRTAHPRCERRQPVAAGV